MRLLYLKLSLQLSRRLCFKVKKHTYLLTIRKVVKIDDKTNKEIREKIYK